MIAIFDKHSIEEYSAFLKKKHLSLDIYYNPLFLTLDAEMQKGELEIFTFLKSDFIFIYPFIKIPVPLNGFHKNLDISSPYGYCGPYANTKDFEFWHEAESNFLLHASKSKFVSEFCRYHYLFNQDKKFAINCENLKNRSLVVLNLERTFDNIWVSEFSGKTRNLTRKLAKENFQFESWETDASIEEFYQLYISTMDNAKASSFYYFDLAFMKKLKSRLKEKLRLFRVIKDGTTYAASMFFIEGSTITYYLSARNTTHIKVAGNNFLLAKTVEWAVENKLKLFNFGGGLKNDVTDSLFKFKKNFSTEICPFYIGKRIHDPRTYKKICDYYIRENGAIAYEQINHMVQFYR